jgi:phosphoribosylformimino-5-aminoimidazole carboxamide ribotide isomerase
VIVIPAIDVRGGHAVRLLRGDPDTQTTYGDDPVELAIRFQDEGARRLHVVDLDAALDSGSNADLVEAICRSVAIPVQVGGGIRSLDDIGRAMRWGAARAIVGTAAVHDVSFVSRAVEEYAEHVLVAIDGRGGRAKLSGWQQMGPPIDELVPALTAAGTPRLLVTSIARDGTLEGPDLTLYRRIQGLIDRPVIARGGVRSAEDVWALRDLGCEAAVTGKALYERRLKLSQVTRGPGQE